MKKAVSVCLQTVLVCGMFILTGCENGNLFGKLTDTGDSNSPQILISEGQDALRDGNYSGALALFEKALDIDPDNAQALYGAAVAAMGGSGFNLGALISNVTTQSASVQGLSGAIRTAKVSASAVHTAPGSILEGIDLTALSGVLDDVLCRLHMIVSGTADDSLRPDNANVLINMGLVSIIRGVVNAINQDQGYFDITNTNDLYAVQIDGDFDDADCGDPTVISIAKDVVTAWHLFNEAADVLGFSGDQLIVQLRNDVDDAIDDLFDQLDPGYPTCLSNLQTQAGLTPGGFTDPADTTVFTPGSGDYCI